MSDAGVLPLIIRMVVSLGAVLAVIGVAYGIARRRAGGGSAAPRSSRRRRVTTPPPIEVVGRAGLTRGSVAVAVRFGDRVVLVGVAEEAPVSVLQDMDATRWDELREPEERLEPIAPEAAAVAQPDSIIAAKPPSLIDALREATTRRG